MKQFLLIMGAVGLFVAALFWYRKKRGVVVQSLVNEVEKLSFAEKVQLALNQVLINEGGYANNPADAGGETNFGISAKWHPQEDIKNMTRERAIEIYLDEYVNPLIKAGIIDENMSTNDIYQRIDCAINTGVSRCKQLLAKVSSTKSFEDVRREYYTSIATGNKVQFLNGWLKRVNVTI